MKLCSYLTSVYDYVNLGVFILHCKYMFIHIFMQTPMNATQSVELELPKPILSPCGYIEYVPGDLNIIISAPHGGSLWPISIPDRDAGTCINNEVVYDHKYKNKDKFGVRTISDIYTVELSLMVAKELLRLTGRSPHIIINQLYRATMDANCDIEKATFNVEEAKTAWLSFHEYIDHAKQCISGCGLFIDIHGQSHPEEWIELGYCLTATQLDKADFDSSVTSLRNIASSQHLDMQELISGSESLGAYLEHAGYSTVPSPQNPSPRGNSYYAGGYNTERHGSKSSGYIDAIQIECPRIVRDKSTAPQFSKSLANSIYKFWRQHYMKQSQTLSYA